MSCAIDHGINVLDTAGAYGDSEVVIGNWLKTVSAEERPFIVTKAANIKTGSLEIVRNDLQKRVAESKARLGVEQLDMFMLHHFDDYLKDKDSVRQVMEELKQSGEVKFRALCEKYRLAPACLALSYALSLPGVTSLVLGSEKVEQVQQNIELLQTAPQLTEEQLKEIHDTFYDTPARVLNPSKWVQQ